ncbi:protein croquemort-like [Anopheles cruzii]|uniref:protein croquemort-like n=1 Tax=Anopheles cruzii TaxID=68878 RepID=UPI0022EC579A|nr:protein croquemort-like [Anopheles cruzii]
MGCCWRRCSNSSKPWWAIGGLVAIFATAGFFGFGLPAIIDAVALAELRIKAGTSAYGRFFDDHAQRFLDIYVFNWTNADEVRNPDVRPHFVQLGPYVFSERRQRENVSFDDDGASVTFSQKRVWHHIPEVSGGDYFNDLVTTLNPVLSTIGNLMEGEPLQSVLDSIIMLNSLGELLYQNVPVHQMLFDGYPDVFLQLQDMLSILPPGSLPDLNLPPGDRFGWFVERNDSFTFDGTFQMGTGADDRRYTGILHQWNGQERVPHYRGLCGEVRGSAGDVWPPLGRVLGLDSIRPVALFLPEVCRAITLRPSSRYTLDGLDGELWVADGSNFDNGHTITGTECQCTAADSDQCPVYAAGVLDVSSCRFGIPLVSYPHFYLADPSYADAVTGLTPDRALHEYRLALHPFTGIPMAVSGRLQYNMHLRDNGFTLFHGMPDVVIPAFWVEQRMVLSEDMANKLKLMDTLRQWSVYVAYGICGLGAILYALTLYAVIFVWKD